MHLIEIQFDNDADVYYAGQVLKGVVLVTLRKDTKIPPLKLRLEGNAKVFWTKWLPHESTNPYISTYGQRHKDAINCNDVQNLVCLQQDLVEAETKVHPKGTVSFPFSINIPKNLASSFEHGHAYVRYCVEVTPPPSPWSPVFAPKACSCVNILQPIDPNIPQYLAMDEGTADITCLAKGSRVLLQVGTDRAAYVPGENIHLTAAVQHSGKVVQKAEGKPYAKLVQRCNSLAKGSSKCSRKAWPLEPIDKPNLTLENIKSHDVYGFRVPPDVEPSISLAILQISYYLEVGMSAGEAHSGGLAVFLPIVIATIPFQERSVAIKPVELPEVPRKSKDFSLSSGLSLLLNASAPWQGTGLNSPPGGPSSMAPPVDVGFPKSLALGPPKLAYLTAKPRPCGRINQGDTRRTDSHYMKN